MEKIAEFEIEDSEKLKVWGLSPISPVTIAAVSDTLHSHLDCDMEVTRKPGKNNERL